VPESSRLLKTAEYGPPVEDEHLYKVVDAIDEVAKETGNAVPDVALNWLLQRPTVASILIGVRDEQQLRQNLASAGWDLTPQQIAKLDAASEASPAYPYPHKRQFTERNPLPTAAR
jgi:aryl-alcohol dehydrogenase-like predicted oxidoreductase